jgi:hypothetical protein
MIGGNDLKIESDEDVVKFVEDKVGNINDWRASIESALWEWKYKK